MKNKVLDGLLGLCVGDALGVPVEFKSRGSLKKDPVIGMNLRKSGKIQRGTYNQLPGTWSDDSSLAFCLAESLCEQFDLRDVGDKFCDWFQQSYWTPRGVVFDIGTTTLHSITKLRNEIEKPEDCGGKKVSDNGNGSLMRILPLAYHVKDMPIEKQFELTHKVSCLTHGHLRSQMSCGIYIQIAVNLLEGDELNEAYEKARINTSNFYAEKPYSDELKHFSKVLENDISQYPEDEIESSGYVISTLEAALWSLLTSDSYEETVLKAVNLGYDTDTTAAIAGGLAGIYYGAENIPKKWVEQIARKDDIKDLAERLNSKLYGGENA